jgi:symplekin
MNPSTQSLGQLESARALALGDGRYYPTIIPGVLPIIGPNANASIEIRRWGADFLAETFASPAWPLEAKEASCLSVLPTLKGYLTAEDNGIVKSAVQAAASIYPLVFKHTYVLPPPVKPFCYIVERL